MHLPCFLSACKSIAVLAGFLSVVHSIISLLDEVAYIVTVELSIYVSHPKPLEGLLHVQR